MLSRGFTLIELAITVSVLSLLLLGGISSLTDTVDNTRIRSTATQLAASLQAARATALRTNNSVAYALTSQGSWTARLPDNTVAKRGQLDFVSRVSVSPSSTTLSFSSIGSSTFQAYDFRPTDANACRSSGGNVACLRVEVLTGGAIRVCDPSLNAGSSDYACSS